MVNKEKKKPIPEKRYTWLIVQRLTKTGRNIRSLSCDPETDDILSQVDNVSKFVCDAVKEKWRRKSTGKPLLSLAEEEFWNAVRTFFVNHKIFDEPFTSRKYWFIPLEELPPEFSSEVFSWAEEWLQDDLEQAKGSEFEMQMREALQSVKKAREDKDYWHKLYEKFRRYWEWWKHAPTDKWGRIIES